MRKHTNCLVAIHITTIPIIRSAKRSIIKKISRWKTPLTRSSGNMRFNSRWFRRSSHLSLRCRQNKSHARGEGESSPYPIINESKTLTDRHQHHLQMAHVPLVNHHHQSCRSDHAWPRSSETKVSQLCLLAGYLGLRLSPREERYSWVYTTSPSTSGKRTPVSRSKRQSRRGGCDRA